eukprot:112352_1
MALLTLLSKIKFLEWNPSHTVVITAREPQCWEAFSFPTLTDLKRTFGIFGQITGALIALDGEKSFALCEFSSPEAVSKTVSMEFQMENRSMLVETIVDRISRTTKLQSDVANENGGVNGVIKVDNGINADVVASGRNLMELGPSVNASDRTVEPGIGEHAGNGANRNSNANVNIDDINRDRSSANVGQRNANEDKRNVNADKRSVNTGQRSVNAGQRNTNACQRSADLGHINANAGQRSPNVGQRNAKLNAGQRSNANVDQRNDTVDQRSANEGQRSANVDMDTEENGDVRDSSPEIIGKDFESDNEREKLADSDDGSVSGVNAVFNAPSNISGFPESPKAGSLGSVSPRLEAPVLALSSPSNALNRTTSPSQASSIKQESFNTPPSISLPKIRLSHSPERSPQREQIPSLERSAGLKHSKKRKRGKHHRSHSGRHSKKCRKSRKKQAESASSSSESRQSRREPTVKRELVSPPPPGRNRSTSREVPVVVKPEPECEFLVTVEPPVFSSSRLPSHTSESSRRDRSGSITKEERNSSPSRRTVPRQSSPGRRQPTRYRSHSRDGHSRSRRRSPSSRQHNDSPGQKTSSPSSPGKFQPNRSTSRDVDHLRKRKHDLENASDRIGQQNSRRVRSRPRSPHMPPLGASRRRSLSSPHKNPLNSPHKPPLTGVNTVEPLRFGARQGRREPVGGPRPGRREQFGGSRQNRRQPLRFSGLPKRPILASKRALGPPNRQTGPQNRQTGPQNRQTGPQNRQTGPQKRQIGPPNRQTGPAKRPAAVDRSMSTRTGHYQESEDATIRSRCFITHLPSKTSPVMLADCLARYGRVVEATIPGYDRGEFPGYGFVQFETTIAAQKARDRNRSVKTAEVRINGCRVVVDRAKSRPAKIQFGS